MKITITIDGIDRDYQGDTDTIRNQDWNETISNFIDDMTENYETLKKD